MKDFIWQAKEYRKHSSIQNSAALQLLKQIELSGSKKILDVGCGDGKISAEIANFIPSGYVIGLDSSSEMITFAKKMFPKESYPNLDFLIKDASHIDFNEEFDLIFSSFALQWVSDIDLFFKRAYKSLKLGGDLVVTVPLDISKALEQSIEEIISQPKWNSYFLNFSPGWNFRNDREYKQILSTYPLKINYFFNGQYEKIFPSKKSFEKYVIQWFSYLTPLPQNLQQTFFKEIIDKYFEIEPQLFTNEVRFVFSRLDFIATKIIL